MVKTRMMTVDDYEGVYELWSSVAGIGLNSSDDSFEGFKDTLSETPTQALLQKTGKGCRGYSGGP